MLPVEQAEAHKRAMRERSGSFKQFTRNGVWGTCVDCLRDTERNAYPEFCVHKTRYDHHLTLKDLVEAYEAHNRK